MRARRYALALLALAAVAAPRAHAQAPASITSAYSPYESESIESALSARNATIEPHPEGQTIEGIDVVALDVVEPRDPAPRALNALHTTTRDYVILREVLVRAGDPYRAAMVDETARNLRALPQLSLVLCIATRGKNPGGVRVMVITKDVWSLLVDFDLAYTAGGLESLLLEPKEKNLFGTHGAAVLRLHLAPESFSLGASYLMPRLEGRRLALSADANVIVNRRSGALEGSFGSVTIARPLYSTRTEWAWLTGVAWRDEVFRRYVDARVATFDGVPYAYRARTIAQEAALVRSFGWATKNDFTIGAEISKKEYRAPDLSAYDPAAAAAFVATQLPVGEARVGPFAQWRGYSTSYVRVLDFETLGLQEDLALGHDLVLRAYPVFAALGSSRTFLGAYGAAQYTWALGDGVARIALESTTEIEVGRVSDASLSAAARIVTPRIGIGRLVVDAVAVNRWENHLNVQSFLGGDTRLRGWPSRYFVGKDLVAMNFEYRSRPIRLASIHLGCAAFYDVGEAFTGFDHLQPRHSVGFGARLLFPQIDRIALRLDVGFPVVAGALPAGVSPASFFLAFHQAFPVPSVGGPVVRSATAASPTIGGALGD